MRSVLWAAAALYAQMLAAQQPAAEELPKITVEVDVVNVLCSVRDKKGGLVGNLTKDDFIVLEDGRPQEIRYFSREVDLPLTIGLLVDVSKSQESLIEIEKRAAAAFFAQVLRPKDLAFLISFGVDAELLQDLTGSVALLREGLDQLRLNAAVGGPLPGPVPAGNRRGTILYDAVYLAADERLRHEVGRKVMVIISDGVDVGSRLTREQAIEAAQKADAIIYSICYADPRYQFFADGYGTLKRMSEETGGRVFRVSRREPLEAIFAEIQEEMRSQYSIGYTPSNPAKDGSFRRLEIQTRQKGLKVQARKGYYAIKRS